VNEVSSAGTFNTCGGTATAGGADWVELQNRAATSIDITNFTLYDDNGPTSPAKYTFPSGTVLPANGFLLLCQNAAGSFTFGIGGNDIITLANRNGTEVSTTGRMTTGLGTNTNTIQLRDDGITYSYAPATPNAVNVFPQTPVTAPVTAPVSAPGTVPVSAPVTALVINTVFVNEVANTAVAGVCNAQDWVELINTGPSAVNLSGFILHDNRGPDNAEAFIFPSNFTILAGQIILLCGSSPGNFVFGINAVDTVTLLDRNRNLLSTTGALPGFGTGTSTYQRTSNNTYQYASPTPGLANFVTFVGIPVINEIAPNGTSIRSVCGGGPYIEILNDASVGLDLNGYVLSIGSAGTYTFPVGSLIANGAFSVFCQNETYLLPIGASDTVTIRNQTGSIVSSSGQIGGNNTRPNAIDLTWSRVVDLIKPSAPFTPFYQYSLNPTPNKPNVFSFAPIALPRQACGIQAGPLGPLKDYFFKELFALDLGRNPEFSGGTFDPRTCNNLVVGDEGNLNEIAYVNSTVSLLRTFPIIGGSTDTEGICFWYNELTMESKVVITDERDRSRTLNLPNFFISFFAFCLLNILLDWFFHSIRLRYPDN
jgi:hypothetical protein